MIEFDCKLCLFWTNIWHAFDQWTGLLTFKQGCNWNVLQGQTPCQVFLQEAIIRIHMHTRTHARTHAGKRKRKRNHTHIATFMTHPIQTTLDFLRFVHSSYTHATLRRRNLWAQSVTLVAGLGYISPFFQELLWLISWYYTGRGRHLNWNLLLAKE